MESWCLSKLKSWLLTFMMLLMFIVGSIQCVCIKDERNALLEIKASLRELSNFYHADNYLSTWVHHGIIGDECCDWERIKCDTTTGHITHLSLSNILSIEYNHDDIYNQMIWSKKMWRLNVSPFLHFKELISLDLSWNSIDDTIVNTGLERLSSLKKLEILNLSSNYVEANIFSPLGEFTSLKVLNLSYINGHGNPPTHDIFELSTLGNLEVLDLNSCGYYGTLQMPGSIKVPILKKIKILNLGGNYFNESIITSISALSSLKALDLSSNPISGSFPSRDLSRLTNLEKLDLSSTWHYETPSIQGCKSLMRMKRLESINIAYNNFTKSIISCLSFLPFLKILDLSGSSQFGGSFPMQELSSLRELKKLDLMDCGLKSITLNGTMSNLEHLNLDENNFNDNIMRSMDAFPSLRFLSLQESNVGGRLFANEPPNLPHLEVLLLSNNNFRGILPIEALSSFRLLEVLDLKGNNFVGSISSTIKSLLSLKVISLAYNMLNGSLPDDGFCKLKNLHELDLSNNMFDGNLPECLNMLSSLKLFDISSNQFTGIIFPSLIPNLPSLKYVDFSHNKFEGSFSFSSFSGHKSLEFFWFERDNNIFEVETEEPTGWIPLFQLKVFVLSNWYIKRNKGCVIPCFLRHQRKLRAIDLSHNSLEGSFPNWLLKNNRKLEVLKLRNNSFRGVIHMELYRNANIKLMDISGNHMIGTIPKDIQKFYPHMIYLNFSGNALNGSIPSSIGDLSELQTLDLSNNEFSGEVPKSLFTNLSWLSEIKLSKNKLHGQILSGNLSLEYIDVLHLDSNCFTGNIGNLTHNIVFISVIDISDNLFTGKVPSWINQIQSELVMRKNELEGSFPCGRTSFKFLDISQNSFSGLLPSCFDFRYMEHLHLGCNGFTGLVPNAFRNLTKLLSLDLGHNKLSGNIPKFLGELSNLRILLLGKNNFVGSIPKQLCQLNDLSLIDLSSNSLSGLIPRCLQNITGPKELAFIQKIVSGYAVNPSYTYGSVIHHYYSIDSYQFESQDEAQFTTKRLSYTYKGNMLDHMSGLDLSCNKLSGEIPQELGLLSQIHVLNLSHNQLTGVIPTNFSNLANIESLDLSSNNLSGKVPSELIKLTYLEVFNISYNNLSGRLPEMKAQFNTFTKENYEGNPLLCGPPLENNCPPGSQVSHPSNEKGSEEKWYDMDMASFYGSSGSTWLVFMLGFAALVYINPNWRRRWLDFVEECTFTCYYFYYDSIKKVSMLFHN